MCTIASLLLCTGFINDPKNGTQILIEPLHPYVDQVLSELYEVPADRKLVLNQIAEDISIQLQEKKEAQLIYICTHNSRRSHMAQLWAQTAASPWPARLRH